MKVVIAFMFLLMSSAAFAESQYIVKTEVLSSNNLLGQPTLVLEPGVPSGASVEGSYQLSIIASPAGEGRALLKTELEVGEESHSPSMMVDLGKESKVTIGDTTLIVTVKEFNAKSM